MTLVSITVRTCPGGPGYLIDFPPGTMGRLNRTQVEKVYRLSGLAAEMGMLPLTLQFTVDG